MPLPKPSGPSVTTTSGMSGAPRCHECGERSPVLFPVGQGRRLCGECHPRGAEIIRVVPPDEE